MTLAQKLNRIAAFFFVGGFLLSKFQNISNSLAATIFRFAALGLYIIANIFGLIACLFYPEHKGSRQKWYGFAQIREQFFLSTFIGLIATLLSIAALLIPALFPITTWFSLVGSTISTIGEYHKLKNPPPDNKFSYTQQKNHVSFTIVATTINFVAAVATTLIFFFPLMFVPITFIALSMYIVLGAFAFEFWLNCNFGNHQFAPVFGSYEQMQQTLEPSLSHEPPSEVPGYFSGLFESACTKEKVKPINESNEVSNEVSEPKSPH